MRACYTGPAATRGVGDCHDGTQVCASSGELAGVYGPCTGSVLPSGHNCTPDAGPDAAPSDSGIPPHCHLVMGFNGNGTFADGSLYCEGQGFFGEGGLGALLGLGGH